jgi:hypothetical protein
LAPRGLIYRGLALAQEGTGDIGALRATLTEWAHSSGADDTFRREYSRLCQRFPELDQPMEAQPAEAR